MGIPGEGDGYDGCGLFLVGIAGECCGFCDSVLSLVFIFLLLCRVGCESYGGIRWVD